MRRRLSELRRSKRAVPQAHYQGESLEEPAAELPPIPLWQRELLELMLREPQWWGEFVWPEVLPVAPQLRPIVEACRRLDAEGTPPAFDRLLLEFESPRMKTLLVELDEAACAKSKLGDRQRFDALLVRLGQMELEETVARDSRRARDSALDEEEQIAILDQVIARRRNAARAPESTVDRQPTE